MLTLFPHDKEIIVELYSDVMTKILMTEIIETFEQFNFNPYEIENEYHPDYYINLRKLDLPKLNCLKELPENQTNVVFRKHAILN